MTTLADILDDPNYTNANAATKQAIFDKYSADEPNYTNANAATQAAIRQRYGLSAPQAAAESGAEVDLTPQALSVARGVAEPLAGVAKGVANMAVGSVKDIGKMGSILYNNLTPGVVAEMVGSPIKYGKEAISSYVAGHPWMNQAANMTPKQAVQGISSLGGRLAGGVVSGLTAPESLMSLPYQMAGYEAEKIRANPNAPEYATNPYAQMTRGEYATQGQAGAANRRASIQGFNTAGNPANPQMPAAQPVAQQPPTAGNYLERMIEISKRFRL